jgi:hypothetical protein
MFQLIFPFSSKTGLTFISFWCHSFANTITPGVQFSN